MQRLKLSTVPSSPFFIIAVALLLVNDHYFKPAYPGFLTGKLSDVVGLFAFPLFVAAFLPTRKLWAYIGTGVCFIMWKLPVAEEIIAIANTLLPFSIGRTIDYSDYWALLILPVSYFYTPRHVVWDSKFLRAGVAVIACLSFCATAGTHGEIKSYHYRTSKYELQSYIDSVFARYPELNDPSGDSLYPDWNDPYFKCYLLDRAGTEVFVVHYYRDKAYWDEHPNYCRISIVYTAQYGQRLKTDDDLSSEERERVIKKFEAGFIAKLSAYIAPSSSDEGDE